MRDAFVGREEELSILNAALEGAGSGKGCTLFVTGEAGIGKTMLVDRFLSGAACSNCRLRSTAASPDTVRPFMLFSGALDIDDLIEARETTGFTAVFAIDNAGMLLAQSSIGADDGLDADIFAGMLTAVQNFVKDSFGRDGQKSSSLGRLEYGDMTILIENGDRIFLTGILSGQEHPDMLPALRSTLRMIEEQHGDLLDRWSGASAELVPVQAKIDALADRRFTIRPVLEGVKLENERIRISDEILLRLKHQSDGIPVILHMDDIQWADESSLFVLSYLARNISSMSILVLATMRPQTTGPVADLMETMREDGLAQVIHLKSLGHDHVHHLIDVMFPDNDIPDTFKERIAKHCNGNPFFIIGVLRQMASEGSITPKHGKYRLIDDDIGIPQSVEDVIHRRMDALDVEPLSLIEYASCIGHSFTFDVAASHPSITDTATALASLTESGILTFSDDVYEFSHPILHEVIYDGLSERWRSAFHLNLGRYYETERSPDSDQVVFRLAKHYSRSREHDKGVEYAMMAGDRAEASYAMEQAIDFSRDALACLGKTRRPDRSNVEMSLRERIGQLCFIISDYENAKLELDTAFGLARDDRDKARILRLKAEIFERTGDYDTKLELLDEGLAILGDRKNREYVNNLLSQMSVYRRRGEFDQALARLEEAAVVMEGLEDVGPQWANYHNGLGLIDWRRGDYDSAISNLEKASEIFSELGMLKELAASKSNIGSVYTVKGEFDRAKQMYSEGIDIFEKMGDKALHSVLLNNMGNLYSDTGDMNTALDYYFRCLEVRERIGDKRGIGYSLNNIGNIMKFLGRFDEALDYCLRSQSILENIGDRIAIPILTNNMAHIKSFRGDIDGAMRLYEKSLKMSVETGNRKTEVTTRCDIAEIYLERGMTDKALEHAITALEVAETIGGKLEEGIARRLMGMISREVGDAEASVEEFKKAAPLFEAMGDCREIARLDYEYGLLFKKTGNNEKAIQHLKKALGLFKEQGMEYWASRVSEVLAAL